MLLKNQCELHFPFSNITIEMIDFSHNYFVLMKTYLVLQDAKYGVNRKTYPPLPFLDSTKHKIYIKMCAHCVYYKQTTWVVRFVTVILSAGK